MLYRQLAALFLALAILPAAGCGGSSNATQLTKTELIAKADAICARFHVEYHAHGSRTPQDFARNIPLLASYEQTTVAELRKLTPPASMANDWKQIVDGTQALADDTTKVVPYAKENRLNAVLPLVTAGQRTQQRILLVAKRDGFKDCARAS